MSIGQPSVLGLSNTGYADRQDLEAVDPAGPAQVRLPIELGGRRLPPNHPIGAERSIASLAFNQRLSRRRTSEEVAKRSLVSEASAATTGLTHPSWRVSVPSRRGEDLWLAPAADRLRTLPQVKQQRRALHQ